VVAIVVAVHTEHGVSVAVGCSGNCLAVDPVASHVAGPGPPENGRSTARYRPRRMHLQFRPSFKRKRQQVTSDDGQPGFRFTRFYMGIRKRRQRPPLERRESADRGFVLLGTNDSRGGWSHAKRSPMHS
jgi:hypothetical protein